MKNTEEELAGIKKLELKAKEIVKGFLIGQHKSPMQGYSVEFAEHKMYNAGESTKHIDWKLYARTEKLYQKKYEEETNVRCQIILDISSSMLYPKNQPVNKLNFSIYASAALIQLMMQQRDGIGISFCSDIIEKHFPSKLNPTHIRLLYHELSALETLSNRGLLRKTNISEALHQLAESLPRRCLIIIFSDMFENIEETESIFHALQHLKHKKHDVIIFHTLHFDTEVYFEFENRPYRFIDMESGEEVKLDSMAFKNQYTDILNKFIIQLKEKCFQYKIDYIAADIKNAYYTVLQEYLIARTKMLKK